MRKPYFFQASFCVLLQSRKTKTNDHFFFHYTPIIICVWTWNDIPRGGWTNGHVKDKVLLVKSNFLTVNNICYFCCLLPYEKLELWGIESSTKSSRAEVRDAKDVAAPRATIVIHMEPREQWSCSITAPLM